jgi:F1F0 ATPase subunit 2
MGKKRMSTVTSFGLLTQAAWPNLAVAAALGAALGAMYFGSLWWNVRLLATAGRARAATALLVGRFAVLGGALTLLSLHGAPMLIAATLGLFLARAAILRTALTS